MRDNHLDGLLYIQKHDALRPHELKRSLVALEAPDLTTESGHLEHQTKRGEVQIAIVDANYNLSFKVSTQMPRPSK